MGVSFNSNQNKATAVGEPVIKAVVNPADYVTKSWMPVSEEVLKNIKQKCKLNLYGTSPVELLHDLKQDIGLFSWFLSTLPISTSSSLTGELTTQLFEGLSPEQYTEVFEKTEFTRFPHSVQGSPKAQSSCLKHAIISSATAEVLAGSADVEPELVHLCSVIRQAGLNLIAWNYPRIYARTLARMADPTNDLGKELSKVLGFSPLALATKLCASWEPTEQLKSLIIQTGTERPKGIYAVKPKEFPIERRQSENLQKCLDLGDAMAKLADPEHFPNHAKEWHKTVGELQDILGSDALYLVQERLGKCSALYSKDNFNFPIDLEPKKNLTFSSQYRVADVLLSCNDWIPKCQPDIQKKFRAVYSAIDRRTVSTKAIELLITDLIPKLGFHRGCIYRLDDSATLLKPILRVGKESLSDYAPLSCAQAKDLKHPAVMAVSYTRPIIQEDIIVHGLPITVIAGMFGDEKRKAVLYLEMNKLIRNISSRGDALIHYKAIQKTLADCMNLT